jgi:O-acetyl-ADP-ribose deacetylase (regulator of RNase III)
MAQTLEQRIAIHTGDITKLHVDVIVNAANSSLMGGGGVDGAIHRGAGPELPAECKKIRSEQYPQGLPTGQAVLTGAGRLPCTYVIHTVGPVWRSADAAELDRKLADCYRNSLLIAEKYRLHSIAFPAVSTGIYGFPKDRAAVIAYKTVADFLSTHEIPQKVYFVFFTGQDTAIFKENTTSL